MWARSLALLPAWLLYSDGLCPQTMSQNLPWVASCRVISHSHKTSNWHAWHGKELGIQDEKSQSKTEIWIVPRSEMLTSTWHSGKFHTIKLYFIHKSLKTLYTITIKLYIYLCMYIFFKYKLISGPIHELFHCAHEIFQNFLKKNVKKI